MAAACWAYRAGPAASSRWCRSSTFAIVFGLSMDYEVFLVARVLEARRSGLSEKDAIPEGWHAPPA